jgi:hypothetical protein
MPLVETWTMDVGLHAFAAALCWKAATVARTPSA